MIADWGTGVRWWGWVPGIVATIVFWALVIWAIVVLARWARSGGNGPAGPGGPDGPRDTGGHGDVGGGPGQALARRHVADEIGAGTWPMRSAPRSTTGRPAPYDRGPAPARAGPQIQ